MKKGNENDLRDYGKSNDNVSHQSKKKQARRKLHPVQQYNNMLIEETSIKTT